MMAVRAFTVTLSVRTMVGGEGWAILTLIEFEGDKDEVGACLECVLEEMVENENVSQRKK
jgi:hypothetical protein